ncbi:MAG: SNF2-related protein [Verrucomicrobiota bacterium]|jgi:superfamily II DNA or RNA helicase
MPAELTEALLATAAGWEVMKRARFFLEQEQVLSSLWAPPLLRGVVREGEGCFRASMVIQSSVDIENLCTCREAREWGKICAHGVAVGLHWLDGQKTQAVPALASPPEGRSAAAPAARNPLASERDVAGEPAALWIILPPNFEQAIARGKVMLVLEAQWSGGRAPLNALPKGRSFAFPPPDLALIEQLETLTHGQTPVILQMETKAFAALLPALAGHPNLTLGRAGAVIVTPEPLQLPLRATLEANGEIVLALAGEPQPRVMIGDWVWQNHTLRPLGLPPAMRDVLCAPVRLSRLQVPEFLSRDWPQLEAAGGLEANFEPEDFTLEPQAPRFLLELKGGLAQLAARLQCAYGVRTMTVGVSASAESVWLPDPQAPTRYATRDLAAEGAALARLRRSGFSGPDAQGRLQLQGQEAVFNFFAREFPNLQRAWTVTLEERLERSAARNMERIQPRFQITSGLQWFDLGVVFASDGGEIFSAADIQRLLLSGQSHTRLSNGKMAVMDTGAVEELQEVLLDCAPRQQEQGWRISNTQAGFLDATLRQHADWPVQAPAAWRERAACQSGEAKPACPPLGDLETVLRPYQKEGVAWLRFLRENEFGGILADEMGLGKTLQTLAFLNTLRMGAAGERRERRPHLIVCPTSLVFNWMAEAEKFTPGLKMLALHGPDRHARFDQIPASDVVVSSYALIGRDAARYRELEFDTIVLDEAQHIKNRQTRNAQAVKAVKGRRRFVLTGTPLENSVLDLWSIFDFLMPGYLGSAQDFRERYEWPITHEQSAPTQTRLARRLRPFLLRRLKKEVASDLPGRLEQVSYCELTPGQRSVYQQVIEAARREVLEASGAPAAAKSRMLALTALLRLRQVCCDLRLLQLDGINPAETSGKMDLFDELLEEVIDGGHRVLVFSQFVRMLALVRERLAAEGIEYCYLDGSTTDRAAVVERFQKEGSVAVFLISLKAGGVGLNLTGADTVIHLDPWWNPAVEDQATERAHRIGQTKVVTSYKLITRDTVEEKILKLQNRKRDLIQATLGGEEEFSAALTWEEIQELLS